MGVEQEFTIGRRTFRRRLEPGMHVVLAANYSDRPYTSITVPSVRIVTESVTVQPSGNAVRLRRSGGSQILFGEEINEADLRKKTFWGELFNVKVVYRERNH